MRELGRDALIDFDSRPDFGQFVLGRAGLRCVVDEEQVWRVGDAELRVCLWLDERSIYVLLVRSGWPERPPRKSLCLAEVFATATTGEPQRLRGPLLALWKRIALIESRLLSPAPVELPSLPSDAPRAASTLWGLLQRYLEAREPGTPFPLVAPVLESLSAAFGSRIGRETIVAGRAWLARVGLLRHVGDAPGNYGKPTKLWALGQPATSAPTEVDAGPEPQPLNGIAMPAAGDVGYVALLRERRDAGDLAREEYLGRLGVHGGLLRGASPGAATLEDALDDLLAEGLLVELDGAA